MSLVTAFRSTRSRSRAATPEHTPADRALANRAATDHVGLEGVAVDRLSAQQFARLNAIVDLRRGPRSRG